MNGKEADTTNHAVLAGVRTMLSAAGIPEPEAEAFWLFSHVTGFDRGRYLLYARDEMPPDMIRQVMGLAEKRCRRIPLQYLTGTAHFADLELGVNSDVLIPRLDTECLVLEAKDFLREKESAEALRVLDLCTGSGCIAAALAVSFPKARVDASDLSEAALAVAADNARRCSAPVRFFRGDLLEPFREDTDLFDLIVSNPPYIPSAVIDTLDPEVKDHEPRLALDGGEDGLSFYRRIAAEAPRFLKEDGALMLEIGADQGEQVREILLREGFDAVTIHPDLAGKDRVAAARMHVSLSVRKQKRE